jgi:hypothetical protein
VSNLVYRPYQPEDAERLCRLHQSVFGVSRTPEVWHWKYRANPAGDDASFLAEDTDTNRIVGQIGLIPLRVGVSGEAVLACQSLDVLVEEEYRSRLVYIELLMRLVDRVAADPRRFAFAFAFGEAVTIKVSTRLLEFRSVAPIPRMVKALSLVPYVPRRLRAVARAADVGLGLATRPRTTPPPSGAGIQRVSHFDSRYDQFWLRQAPRCPLALWRDSAYLNWRYLDAPGANYEAYAVERQGELLGFSVLRSVTVGGRRRGRILELIAEDEAVTASLLTHALRRFWEERLELAASWVLPGDPLYPAMRRRGFRSRPRKGRELIARTVSNAVPTQFITDPTNWRVSMGDADEM